MMCLESLAHLLVMVNFSSNFLVYCSTSSPFKTALTKAKASSKLANSKHIRNLDCKKMMIEKMFAVV